MHRLLLLLLTLMLLPFPGIAETTLSFQGDLVVKYSWPEGASDANASYLYTAVYPQVAGDDALALTINNVFAYEASDALGFECPMIGSSHSESDGKMVVNITYQITHLSAEALSVRIDKVVTLGDLSSHIIKGFTFALTGAEAGTVTSLPYLLGIIEDGETDEWLVDRQVAKADVCARDLVWLHVQSDMRKEGSPLYQDMTFEEFEWGFYPEEDFYLDEDGNYVFFLQEGVIAPVEAGLFFYTITLDELLDEI